MYILYCLHVSPYYVDTWTLDGHFDVHVIAQMADIYLVWIARPCCPHIYTARLSCAQFVGMPVAAVQQILVKVSINCTSHPKYCGSRRIPEAAVQASDRLISDLQLLDE